MASNLVYPSSWTTFTTNNSADGTIRFQRDVNATTSSIRTRYIRRFFAGTQDAADDMCGEVDYVRFTFTEDIWRVTPGRQLVGKVVIKGSMNANVNAEGYTDLFSKSQGFFCGPNTYPCI